MALALGFELLEDLALVRVRLQVDVGDVGRLGLLGALQSILELARVLHTLGIVGLEELVFPVVREGRAELLEDIRRLDLRQAHVPLEPIHERRVGEIRRADERR